jgi:hypothetical protein
LVLHLGVLASIVALVSLLALLTNENRSRATFVTFAIASVIALVTMSLWLFQAVKIGREVNTLGVVTGLLSPLQSAMRVDQPPVTGVLLARAVFTLRERLFLIPLPLFLPVALLAMSLTKRSTWRRDGEARGGLLLLMLSVCVAARLRRGFEHTEWFHVLLEVPTAILFASLAWQHWRDGGLKTQRALLATVAVVGVLAYWHLGTGTLTRRGRGVVTKSARGDVWLGRNQSLDLGALRAVLDSIDPSGTRQLMSAGFTAGFNYHLGRRSASPFTTGFSYSNGWDTDSVIDVVIARRPSTLIIDHPFYVDEVPVRHWSLRQWDRPMELNHHVRLDRPRFDRLLQLCRGGRPAGTGEVKVNDFVVIDCSLTTE